MSVYSEEEIFMAMDAEERARERLLARANGTDDGYTLAEDRLGLPILAEVVRTASAGSTDRLNMVLDVCARVLLARGWEVLND